MIIFVYGITF